MRRTGDLTVDLAGLRALVTGGSRGIAAAIAEGLARNGACVAVNYAAAADAAAGKPEAAQALCEKLGPAALALEADLAEPGAAAALAESAIQAMGGVDILVLSASAQVNKPFLETAPEDVALQLQVNVAANLAILQALLPGMRERGWGRVIAIGSVQEAAPSLRMPVYAMTKAAQENLVRSLALENARFGVTVNNISPGLTETDRAARVSADPELRRKYERRSPMGRIGRAADVVGAALYLASDAAAFVTGVTIFTAGGAQIARAVDDDRW